MKQTTRRITSKRVMQNFVWTAGFGRSGRGCNIALAAYGGLRAMPAA